MLARDGVSRYAIVYAMDALESERTAATELSRYLQKICGADFNVYNEGSAPSEAPKVFIGACRSAKKLCPEINWRKLDGDRVLIKIREDNLIIAGGRPRGSLYAVYSFLEDVLGCKWWTSTEETIPQRSKIYLKRDLEIDYTPPIKSFRSSHYRNVNRNFRFAAKLKSNGYWQRIPDSWGGHFRPVPNFAHTVFMLLPPDKYFKEHPEWYSMLKGKRTSKGGQLCLTNRECRKEFTRNALEALRRSPGAKALVVAPMDHGKKSRCQCPSCLKLEIEEGAPSGPLIQFVNEVAREVKKEFPGVMVLTYAYQYTNKPPRHVVADENVAIVLCTDKCSINRPVFSEINKEFRDNFMVWKRHAKHFLFWDYDATYHCYIQPNPKSLKVVADNIRFFAENGAIGVLSLGDGYCSVGSFVRLRAWVTGHLLWNPKLDSKELTKEFLKGYYGPAAPHIYDYIEHFATLAKGQAKKRVFSTRDISFVALADLKVGALLFSKAVKAVEGDALALKRVRRARISFDYAVLNFSYLNRVSIFNELPGYEYGTMSDLVEGVIERCRDDGVVGVRELNRKFDVFVKILRAMKSTVPLPDSLQKGECFDFQEFLLAPWAQKIVADKSASNGLASYMAGDTNAWTTQYIIPQEASSKIAKGEILFSIKCDKAAKGAGDTPVFAFGIHDRKTGKTTSRKVLLKEVKNDGYNTYKLKGEHELNSDRYLWVSCLGTDALKGIFVDRAYVVKPGSIPAR
jgi:hypothetical protein